MYQQKTTYEPKATYETHCLYLVTAVILGSVKSGISLWSEPLGVIPCRVRPPG